MSNDGIGAGIVITILIHVGLGAAAVAGAGGFGDKDKNKSLFADAETIEAALAFKKVEKKTKQPQKQKKKKFRPKEKGFTRDEKAKPPKDKKKDTLKPDPDEIDFNATLDKNRQQDPDLSSTGVDELPKDGSDKGSEWGTEREAKGDPYVGELKGRIVSVWQVPTLETKAGTATGCVRLNAAGKIKESELKRRSKNANLNRSVSLALRKAPKMDKPVPAHLKDLLTVRGICFKFNLDAQ